MKSLKVCAFFSIIFTCSIGTSTVRICGNHTYPDGHTSRVCVYFYAKEIRCDSADMLAIVSQPGGFTGGWTCQSDNFGIASTNSGDASLIRTPDGKAFLRMNGDTSQVGSDAFTDYLKRVQRETANKRVNTQAIQKEMNRFLDSDNGIVSDARLQKLSTELGVPIAVSRGWNPKDEPGYHQSKWSGKASEANQPTAGSPQTCIAEYEMASDVEVFFRQDRKITGVWRAKQDNGPKRDRPEYVFADANGCLYGGTGNVWEPLDCPGRDFSKTQTYPRNFKLGASCSSPNTSGLAWRRLSEGRDGVMEAPSQEVPMSRFALVQPTSRPPEYHESGGGPTTRQVYCWVEEDEVAWWLRCCEFTFEILPIDPGPGVSLINEPDTTLKCSPNSGMEMPDVQDGSIVLRTADGRDYCLDPNGRFGVCATDFGIKEKGIK